MFSNFSKGMFRKPSRDSSTLWVQSGSEQAMRPLITTNSVVAEAQAPGETVSEKAFQHKEHILEGTRMNSESSGPQILSIGGGKGGIGKSFFSANTAVCLAQQGYKVAIVDLDLGSANLHTCLGVPSPKVGLFDFVNGGVEALEDVAVSGGIPNLTLYGGGQEFWQQVRPHSSQKIKLISKLQRLDADFVILDLGAGTHVNTLDFFIFSHAGIVVVVPEPTSIENAYVFLKSVLFRKLQSVVKAIGYEEVTENLVTMLADPRNSTPPLNLLQKFALEQPEVGPKILDLMQMTHLGVVMNQVRTKGDIEIGNSITQICKKYFGFNAEFIGSTMYDDNVWKSVRSRRPVCLDFPNSPVAAGLREIADCLARSFLVQASSQVAANR